MTPTEILRQLVAIPTPSAASNLPLINLIASWLEPRGWSAIRLPYTTAEGVEKSNLILTPQQFATAPLRPDILFVCHTDTVPFSPTWTNATHLEDRDGHLHGCGACDVKGSMAAILAAALRVDAPSLTLPIAIALTADEEIGCIGASRLVASGILQPRRVIICEPTSLRPATAGKGYGLAQVHVRGQQAHSAFPAKGVSAINIAAHLIVAIEALAQSPAEPTDARFNPPRTTFNIGVLSGGTAKNIIAGDCRFLVEWRPLPQQNSRAGGERLIHLASEIQTAHPGCTITVDLQRADPGFANPESSTLGPTLSHILNQPQTGISFGSEATRLTAIAEEVVVIGPGDMETAHSDRECIPIHELNQWTDIVERLLRRGG